MPRLDNSEERGCDDDDEVLKRDPQRLIEGLHYYWEGQSVVFTAAYHRARGFCCGSACRHCPFDHVNVD